MGSAGETSPWIKRAGIACVVIAAFLWFVVEPVMREEPAEGVLGTVKDILDPDLHMPSTLLSIASLFVGILLIYKASGRGLFSLSAPEVLGINLAGATSRLPAFYASKFNKSDAVKGWLVHYPDRIEFTPDSKSVEHSKWISFLLRSLGGGEQSIPKDGRLVIPASAITRTTAKGAGPWARVTVITNGKFHDRSKHLFFPLFVDGTWIQSFKTRHQRDAREGAFAGLTRSAPR